MAEEAGEDPDSSFKTLVTVAPSGDHVVCCIPVAQELDFKKAAAAAGEKSLSLIPVKELEGLTGYVRGGCTPVGMKKVFPTLIDETAQLFDTIIISGGRRGLSLTLDPVALRDFLGATFADITR
jgi:Cys-tRNA(Pro)/Cys-tRNA(Cys) deacylase